MRRLQSLTTSYIVFTSSGAVKISGPAAPFSFDYLLVAGGGSGAGFGSGSYYALLMVQILKHLV